MALNGYGRICLEQESGGVMQSHIKLHQPSDRLWYMIVIVWCKKAKSCSTHDTTVA